MDACRSLSHSVWDCKYHIVFIPKCRRKTLYAEPRRHLGEVTSRNHVFGRPSSPLTQARPTTTSELALTSRTDLMTARRTARVTATLIERADAVLCDAEEVAELVGDFLCAADQFDRVARFG